MKAWSVRPLWMRLIGAAICFFLFIELLRRQIDGVLVVGLVALILSAQYWPAPMRSVRPL